MCNITVTYWRRRDEGALNPEEATMPDPIASVLVVRRSIHIQALPARVWQEFESFERMNH